MSSLKISDTSQKAGRGSRADLYWKDEISWKPYFEKMRPGLRPPVALAKENNVEALQNTYKIGNLQFGNWTTIGDRINYVNALFYALHDLNTVLGFKQNIGLNHNLNISFGARGQSKALAHYEPDTDFINLTRYKQQVKDLFGQKIDMPHEVRFLSTGGIGSLAHEYAHYLDYFAGKYLEPNPNSVSLSGGRKITTKPLGLNGDLRACMDKIINQLIWQVPQKKHTTFYTRKLAFLKKDPNAGEYFLRRTEMFARFFEAYVNYVLAKKSIKNAFLTESKYIHPVYPPVALVAKIAPTMKRFLVLYKQKIK